MAAPHDATSDAALTIGLALAAGVLAQTVARHLRIPGIVLLLAVGVALGPDGLEILEPEALGSALTPIVGFAVAVILFEGGLNLRIDRIRRQGGVVRSMLTIGAAVTLIGGALAARFALDWDWRTSLLFGALVIVTGPTVVTPLLRRVRVRRSLQTILETEGVLIDAIGAVVAVVALEIALEPSLSETARGFAGLAERFGVGGGLGLAGGFAIAFALRRERLLPEGLENVTVLSIVLALYQVADAIAPESGIVAATVAGLVLGNVQTPVLRELTDFKEQLTVMLIGLLFVLLAADVRLRDVADLGAGGIVAVAALILLVRPAAVAVSTWRSDLSLRERALLAWVAPRGIVAAAVASLFAVRLADAGVESGAELRALVFLVIAVTVTLQGLTMGPVAGLLGVRRESDAGWVILGASGLGLAVAEALRAEDEEIVLIDSNADRVTRAEALGLRVIFGNGLSERVLARAQPDIRAGGIAATPNEEANLLFVQRIAEEFACREGYVALDRERGHLKPEMVARPGRYVLFDAPRDLGLWSLRLDRGRAPTERWRKASAPGPDDEPQPDEGEPMLPLVRIRGGRALPAGGNDWSVDDEALIAIDRQQREAAEESLRAWGWVPVVEETAEQEAAEQEAEATTPS